MDRITIIVSRGMNKGQGGMQTVMRVESVFAVVLALEENSLDVIRGCLQDRCRRCTFFFTES